MEVMKVLKLDKEEICKIVETKSKFQKVMVLFDDSASNVEVLEIYNSIKDICIYNQADINNLDLAELNNGYRAIIYLCTAENFLKLKFDKNEFINLCIVKGRDILPFCVNADNNIIEKDLYIFSSNEGFDANLFSSLSFNKFYNYLYGVVNLKDSKFSLKFLDSNINHLNVDFLKHVASDFVFIDLDIIAKSKIECKHLCVVHLMLINAFLLMLNSIKNKTLLLVDVYKVCKEDYIMLDKFFAMANNEVFFAMINLNYNYLINLCLKIKEEILNQFIVFDLCESDIENILQQLKEYAKNANNLIGYLYLYDFFKVW